MLDDDLSSHASFGSAQSERGEPDGPPLCCGCWCLFGARGGEVLGLDHPRTVLGLVDRERTGGDVAVLAEADLLAGDLTVEACDELADRLTVAGTGLHGLDDD